MLKTSSLFFFLLLYVFIWLSDQDTTLKNIWLSLLMPVTLYRNHSQSLTDLIAISIGFFYKCKLKEIKIIYILKHPIYDEEKTGDVRTVSFQYSKLSWCKYTPLISCENTDMQTHKPGLLYNRLTTNHKSIYLKGFTDQ